MVLRIGARKGTTDVWLERVRLKVTGDAWTRA